MLAAELSQGMHVSYDIPHVGVETLRVTIIEPNTRVSYVCGDGVPGMWEATIYHTLDAALPRGLRVATSEEAREFERTYRPAPVNYH